MARNNRLHQNVSPAHTAAHLSAGSYSRIVVDGLSTFAFTYTLPAYRAATSAPSAISAGEADP